MSSDQTFSDLVEIAKRNGDFRRNYGKIIGAYLYLRSVSAARSRSFLWNGLMFTLVTGGIVFFRATCGSAALRDQLIAEIESLISEKEFAHTRACRPKAPSQPMVSGFWKQTLVAR